jgi:hypothetical protein
MGFVDALDAIFRLAATWELLYHFKNITWRKAIENSTSGQRRVCYQNPARSGLGDLG